MIVTTLLERVKQVYLEFGVDIKPTYAYISQDCRDQDEYGSYGDLSNHYGIHLGDFYHPNVLLINQGEEDDSKKLHDAMCVHPEEYDDDEYFHIGNPLILSDVGDLIWGIESYWTDLEKNVEYLKASNGLTKKEILTVFEQNSVIRKLQYQLSEQHRLNSQFDC